MVSHKQRGLVGLALGVLWGASACSGSPGDPLGSAGQSISGGALDAQDRNVFGLLIHGGGGVSACSSTLIAPNLLLTARHCVSMNLEDPVVCGKSAFGDLYPTSGIYAMNAPDISASQPDDWYRADDIRVPSEGNDTCGYDVALITLHSNVPAEVAVPAVPRIDRDVQKGESYRAVGYGITPTEDYGIRRLIAERVVQCEPGTCRSGVRASEFVGDSGPCQGDSGGPAFDADGKVVGVDSRGTEECTTPVYSTVTAWRDLIMEVANDAAAAGGYEAPFWAQTGSSDPPVAPPVVDPNPSTPTAIALGDVCDGSAACVADAACYEPGSGGPARCVRRCSASGACADGFDCTPVGQGGDQLCLASETKSGPKPSSCAFGRERSGSSAGFALVAAGLAFARRRRRR
jgi:MYXO-CTERM domain-containing protein